MSATQSIMKLMPTKPLLDGSLPEFTDSEELGGILFHASLVLLHHLETKHISQVRGARVLELGSGMGHLGVGLRLLGAHIICTDHPDYVEGLRASVERIQTKETPSDVLQAAGGSLQVLEYEWGQAGTAAFLEHEPQPFDIIVCAELIAIDDYHDILLDTLQRVCTPKSVIYSVFVDRDFSFAFFAKLDDLGLFDIHQVDDKDFDPLGMQGVMIHIITRRSA